MERVLHCVGDDERWHSDGLPEGQSDGEIATVADKANDDRGNGIFSSVKRREQELIDRHKGQLECVECQRKRCELRIVGSESAMLIEQGYNRQT